MTGAAGVGDGKGRRVCGDDVVTVKSINYMASLNEFTELLSFGLGSCRGSPHFFLLWRRPYALDFFSSRCGCNDTLRSHR